MKIIKPSLVFSGLLALLLLSIPVGQVYAGQYVFNSSPLTDSLSQPTVKEIYQDSQGFLWILTQEGLNRYDGKETRVFRSDIDSSNAISNDNLTGVAEDEEGNLWFGTNGGGLNRFIAETETFETLRKGSDNSITPYSDNIRSVTKGLKGNIWIGYLDGGFSVFDPATRLFMHFTDQRWPVLTGDAVYHVLEEPDGRVWIATDGNGLLKLDLKTESLTRAGDLSGEKLALPSNRISKVFRASDGALWIATLEAGVARLDVMTDELSLISQPPDAGESATQSLVVQDVFEDGEGTVFLATDAGLGIADVATGTIDFLRIRGSTLSFPRVFSVMQDRSGRYWAGAYQGVYTGIRSPFVTINAETGLDEEVVLSVARTDDGNLWV